MKKVLYISSNMPYDKVGHAGGQTFNYYIKGMGKDVDVSLLTFCSKEDYENSDLEEYGIAAHYIIRNKGLVNFCGNILSINSKINPFHKYGNLVTWYAAHLLIKHLKKIKESGYIPDVIVLEWTQIVLLAESIKRVYPSVKLVCSEHDVTFLSYERKWKNETNAFKKYYKKLQYENMHKRELNALNKCDLVYTHNEKDKNLIKDDCKTPINTLVPYYHKSNVPRNCSNNNIIFYGYMRRMENEEAALWFIHNVMPLLKDVDCKFTIIGGGPSDLLKSKEDGRVRVLGFVDVIDEYFAEAKAFVAPMISGAGIKVKVIEAMYTGIPVLTNDIGIEGIEAKDGIDYYRCITPEDYAAAIQEIFKDTKKADETGINGKKCIDTMFNMEDSLKRYKLNVLK